MPIKLLRKNYSHIGAIMSKTGGPAFPVSLTNEQETRWDSAGLGCANGMTLRDYFAAKAM